jgi:spermidine/putrescine transport system ATP-binding protein
MTGHSIALYGIERKFGALTAVHSFDLDIRPGEFIAFMGPSGCGKTTTLRLIAGLERATRGQLLINDVDVTHKKPWERDAPMVWQNFALFPHLDVSQNVAFGLMRRKMPRAEIDSRVKNALNLVGIPELKNRRIDQLSGGQKQRVGIARALVLEPKVLLLDEPLSALDANLRVRLQTELRLLHQRLNVTFVYVTHYQNEALSLADRVVVMDLGKISQVGTPEEIYRHPQNHFVASFVGMNNIFQGRVIAVEKDGTYLQTPDGVFVVPTGPGFYLPGAEASFLIAADRIEIVQGEPSAANAISGIVRGVEYSGTVVTVMMELESGREVRLQKQERELPRNAVRIGEQITVSWQAQDSYVFP